MKRPGQVRVLAASAVPEHWIVNVRDREIEVCRRPIEDRSSPTGSRHSDHNVFVIGQSVEPPARPGVSIPVARLAEVG